MNEGIIKDIGRSYIVSSLLPAALFVSLAALIFRGFAPTLLVDRLKGDVSYFNSASALLVVFTLWLAFALYSGVDLIFRIYEGYKFPHWLKKLFVRSQKRRLNKQLHYYGMYTQVEDKPKSAEREQEIKDLQPFVLAELQPLEIRTPLDVRYLLPTTLGNILRACEIYPLERYKLDGLTLWPRLSRVLPPDFNTDLEEKNNQLVFILNSSLLSYLIGLASFVVALLGWTISLLPIAGVNLPWFISRSFLSRGFILISPYEYFVISIGFLILGYGIYRMSINVAEEYSLYVRSAYDLYRFDLLKLINHSIPISLSTEKGVWHELSQFFVAGQKLGEIQFNYLLRSELCVEPPQAVLHNSPPAEKQTPRAEKKRKKGSKKRH